MSKKINKLYYMKNNNSNQHRLQMEINQYSSSNLQKIDRKNSQSYQVMPVMTNIKSAKSKQDILKEIQQINQQMLLKRGVQQIPNVQIIGNSQYNNQKRQERMLQKQYPNHSYLPLDYLRDIKMILKNYQNAKECRFQKNGADQNLNRRRQQQRLKITKCVVFAIFQILYKISFNEMKDNQKKFTSSQWNKLSLSYEISKEIESAFFKNLFQKYSENKLKTPYKQQIQTILSLFSDKNNLQFRRRIINREYNLNNLAFAKEEDLLSQKSKQENIKKLQQLVRQNEKEQTNNNVIQQQICFEKPIDDYLLKIPFNSVKSLSSLSQKQSKQDKKKRDKEQSIKKNKLICKKAYISISKIFNRMSDNINKLKYDHSNTHKALQKLNNLIEN